VTDKVGNYPLTVKVVDSANAEAIRAFEIKVIAQDTAPPVVSTKTPEQGAQGVELRPIIRVTFSEPMNQTATEAAFSTNPSFTKTFSWDSSGQTLTVYPSEDLHPIHPYVLSLSEGATDLAGNPLVATSWTFTTQEVVLQPSITGELPKQIILQGAPVAIDLTPYESGTGAGEGDEMTWEFVGYSESDPFTVQFDAVDNSGNAYVTGSTGVSNFPTQNPFQGSQGGSLDVFVVSFLSDGSLTPDITPPTPNTPPSITAVSATQIDLTSTAATDNTPPSLTSSTDNFTMVRRG